MMYPQLRKTELSKEASLGDVYKALLNLSLHLVSFRKVCYYRGTIENI
jgi:hypothetical protein